MRGGEAGGVDGRAGGEKDRAGLAGRGWSDRDEWAGV